MIDSVETAAFLAKPFEGLRLNPYHDPVGFPTVGYGHLLSREAWADLSRWKSVTQDEALELLESDMMVAYKSVKRLIKVPLTCGQEAALIDFAFNCGGGNLQISALRMKINRQDYEGAANELNGSKWASAKGVRLPGLVRRRKAEKEVFLGNY